MANYITVLLYVALYFFSALYSALRQVPIVGLYLWAFEKVLWASVQAPFYAYGVWRNLKKTAITVSLFPLWPIILPVAVIDSFIYAVRVQIAGKSASEDAGTRRSWPSLVHSMSADGKMTITVTELLEFLLLRFPITVLRMVTTALKTLMMKTLDLMLLPYQLPLRILKMTFGCLVRRFFGDQTDETEMIDRERNDIEPETLVTQILMFLPTDFPIAVFREIIMTVKTLTMKTLDLMLLPYLLPLRILEIMSFGHLVRSFFGDQTDETETTDREPNDTEPEILNPKESEQVPRAGSVDNDGDCCCRCRCSADDRSAMTKKNAQNSGDSTADFLKREMHEEYCMNMLWRLQSDMEDTKRQVSIMNERLTRQAEQNKRRDERMQDMDNMVDNKLERLSNALVMLIVAASNGDDRPAADVKAERSGGGNGRKDLGDRDGAMPGPSGNGGANGESAGLV